MSSSTYFFIFPPAQCPDVSFVSGHCDQNPPSVVNIIICAESSTKHYFNNSDGQKLNLNESCPVHVDDVQ